MQELQEMRQWRTQFEEQGINKEINAFVQDKEFFYDVKDQMANLLDHNLANGLEDAYKQAIWANPNVRAVLLERERAGGQQTDLKQRQAAAAGAGVKPAGQLAVTTEDDEKEDDLADTIRREFNKAQSGRV
jgi:hypothetical protein